MALWKNSEGKLLVARLHGPQRFYQPIASDSCPVCCPDPNVVGTITVTVSGVTDCPYVSPYSRWSGVADLLNGTHTLTIGVGGTWSSPYKGTWTEYYHNGPTIWQKGGVVIEAFCRCGVWTVTFIITTYWPQSGPKEGISVAGTCESTIGEFSGGNITVSWIS